MEEQIINELRHYGNSLPTNDYLKEYNKHLCSCRKGHVCKNCIKETEDYYETN